MHQFHKHQCQAHGLQPSHHQQRGAGRREAEPQHPPLGHLVATGGRQRAPGRPARGAGEGQKEQQGGQVGGASGKRGAGVLVARRRAGEPGAFAEHEEKQLPAAVRQAARQPAHAQRLLLRPVSRRRRGEVTGRLTDT